MTTLAPPTISEGLRDDARMLKGLRRDGVNFALRRRPPIQHGGDILRIIELDGGRYVIAAGHVMGMDSQASWLARILTDHIVERSRYALCLGDVATSASELIAELSDGERFASLLLLQLDGPRAAFRIVNAGHPEPMAVGRAGGVVTLEGHGPAIGLVPGTVYHEAGPLRLARGMTVLAATEDLFEARRASGDMFGRRRIAKALAAERENCPRAIVRRVLDAADEFAGISATEDRSVLAFQFA